MKKIKSKIIFKNYTHSKLFFKIVFYLKIYQNKLFKFFFIFDINTLKSLKTQKNNNLIYFQVNIFSN